MELSTFKLESAPTVPGIYAWYARFPLGEQDWKPAIHGGIDRSAAAFLDSIVTYGSYFHEGVVDLTGRGLYGVKWVGSVEPQTFFNSGESSELARLESAANEPQTRRLVSALLRESVPAFTTPLYIGVALNLRERLLQHKHDYETAHRSLKSAPERGSELREQGKAFGFRIAGAGVPFEQLVVHVLEVPKAVDGLTGAEARKAAEVAEWTLHRILRPVFGRQ